MSAPTKATGGRRSSAQAAAARKIRGSAPPKRASVRSKADSAADPTRDDHGVARGAPERVSVGSIADSATKPTLTSRRAQSIRAKTPKSKSNDAPSYSNRSTKPRILQAARTTATERGYDRLRLRDITDEAGISHQAFYGHFANKRHAVAVATSDELGAIADLAMRGSKQEEEWAERMLTDIDRTLAATYPATDGPERWLRDRITEAISTDGGFNALRILELIRVSKLGHGEFYRRYGGKRGCLQRIYGEALEEVRGEAGDDNSIASIGEAIASDPERARLLVLGAPHLPGRDEEEEGKATQSSLPGLLAGVVASRLGGNPSDRDVLVIAGGVLEIVRSAVLGNGLRALPEELSTFEPAGGSQPALRLAA